MAQWHVLARFCGNGARMVSKSWTILRGAVHGDTATVGVFEKWPSAGSSSCPLHVKLQQVVNPVLQCSLGYPLVIQHNYGTSPFFLETIHHKWPWSLAMLNYRRVLCSCWKLSLLEFQGLPGCQGCQGWLVKGHAWAPRIDLGVKLLMATGPRSTLEVPLVRKFPWKRWKIIGLSEDVSVENREMKMGRYRTNRIQLCVFDCICPYDLYSLWVFI